MGKRLTKKQLAAETVPVGEVNITELNKLLEWLSHPNIDRSAKISSCRFGRDDDRPEFEIEIEDEDTCGFGESCRGLTFAEAIHEACEVIGL
jgi:hypothetical protein